ncbi:hypothetical protein Tco_0749757 [Tanacetum coccineum]|uniref:Uncharacterized protein n=1 Tax=Tanacetum coccineum TaxID=301880 RepID=A0ABQ4Z0N1_9ASTR
METHCVNMELKYQNQALKDGQHGQILNETSNKAKINKEIKVLEKINIELEHSVAKLLADNEKTVQNADLKAQIQEKVFATVALKNELRKLKGNIVDTKFAKPSILENLFASQVDVNNVLSKPVTQHYLPKRRESAFSKPNHMIASSSSRNSAKNMPRFSSNANGLHNYYLEEAKNKTQEKMIESQQLYPTSHTQKPGRKIVTGHSFSPNKSSAVSSAVHEKTNSPRSCLRWIPIGRIFNIIGLKWVSTGKTFTSSTTKVDCEPPNGSNECITNPYECDQTLNVSAGTLNLSADQHPCFMIMASVDNTSGPVPQRKERCTLQCALSSKEEKSSCILKKDQIDNLLERKKVNEELRKFIGGRLYEGDLRLRQKNHMILSYDVFSHSGRILTDLKVTPTKPGRMTKPYLKITPDGSQDP